MYKARRQLAAIDWNYHVKTQKKMHKDGQVQYTRKYNQRTKQWNVKFVKEVKDFLYIPILMAKMFRKRLDDTEPIARHISLPMDDPTRICPTIAQREAVPSSQTPKNIKPGLVKHNKVHSN